MSEQDILNIISSDSTMMGILNVASGFNLPDWAVGAGFVRNKIWDHLHNIETESTDVDLVYFDPVNINENLEKEYDAILRSKFDVKWSTKNMARMHGVNGSGDSPYSSTEDGIAHWPETATSIGIRLCENKLNLVAPYGIGDLVNLIVRPSPKFSGGNHIVSKRVSSKKWLETWPKLRLEIQ